MSFEITILGSNSALFNHGRHPTAQVVIIRNRHFLIDCGEGTQERMREHDVKWFKIEYIFISHLHGDHYFGLIGLITTFNLLKRTEKLTIFGPKELKKIIDIQLKASNTILNFPFKFIATKDDSKNLILDIPECTVYSFPLLHKVPTTGFLLVEKMEPRQLDLEKIKKYSIAKEDYKLLVQGQDVTDANGKKIKNSAVTIKGRQPHSYAFCSDTAYHLPMVPFVKNVELLYHEATFLEQDIQRANVTLHSTAKQAALIAKKAKAKQLLLGHFSSRYMDLTVFENEAKTVFENVTLALEGTTFKV
ncbi:MAG: hypothetical protein RJA25_341 [Bacteroidota bacterium]